MMSLKRTKFSDEDEEKIIDFVKSNTVLFNVKHKRFRDGKYKNWLWMQLANEMMMDVEVIKKKWQTMRDYYVRKRVKKTTGFAAYSTKRDDSLSFLLQTSKLNRSTQSSLCSAMEKELESQIEIEFSNLLENTDPLLTSSPELTQPPQKKAKKVSADLDTTPDSKEFPAHRPKASEFIPAKPTDDVQLFFDSCASTVRKFPPLMIAQLKLKVGMLIGEAEIAWEQDAAASEKQA